MGGGNEVGPRGALIDAEHNDAHLGLGRLELAQRLRLGHDISYRRNGYEAKWRGGGEEGEEGKRKRIPLDKGALNVVGGKEGGHELQELIVLIGKQKS